MNLNNGIANNGNSSNGQAGDDLSWMAFLYAAGELPEHELLKFEERLASDQAACEAVAQAVALGEAVCVAESSTPATTISMPSIPMPSIPMPSIPMPSIPMSMTPMSMTPMSSPAAVQVAAVHASAWRQTAVWVMVAAAACIAVVIGLNRSTDSQQTAHRQAVKHEVPKTDGIVNRGDANRGDSQGELAVLWVERQAGDEAALVAALPVTESSADVEMDDESGDFTLLPSSSLPTGLSAPPDWLIAALSEAEPVKN